jgi:hypothetical protein
MASEDITFCANRGCPDMKCEMNPKHIRIFSIPHSYAFFEECPKWKPGNARWLREEIERYKDENGKAAD